MRSAFAWLVLLALTAGCATRQAELSVVEKLPLGREIPSQELPENNSTNKPIPARPTPSGVLALDDALELALVHSPLMAAFAWDLRIAESQVVQQSLPPNPELEVEVEGLTEDTDTETTFAISQEFELGRKRAKRRRVALVDRHLAAWDLEEARLQVITATRQAFVGVMKAQAMSSLFAEIVDLSEQAAVAVTERVRAGKVSPIEETRAAGELAAARIAHMGAQRQLTASRARLAASWGATRATFEAVDGDLETVLAPAPLEELAELLPRHPAMARWAAEIERRKASLALEKAGQIPNVGFSAGVLTNDEFDDSTVVAALAIPLPIFDRNQGNIQSARFALARAESEQAAQRAARHADLVVAYENLATAFAEVEMLRKHLIPGALEATTATREGYRQGKIGLLELLDAQRSLFKARTSYVEAQASYQTSRADLEGLIATDLTALASRPASARSDQE